MPFSEDCARPDMSMVSGNDELGYTPLSALVHQCVIVKDVSCKVLIYVT